MEYRPGSTRTVLHRVRGMPFEWSLNPYRGCRHACLYCYARIYHSYIGFDDPGDFDRVVLYKEDLPERLRQELRRRRTPPQGEIAIGTSTDPYQPLEAREQLTRRSLEVLLAHGLPVSITTKSPLVLRDLDLLRRFAAYGGIRVHVTVTVLDAGLWHILEPGTAKPSARLSAVRRLRAAGIPAEVFVAPVIPGPGEAEALRVIEAAREAGADRVMIQLLRLSPGVREWLLPHLERSLPESAAQIQSLYGTGELPPADLRRRLLAPHVALRARLGLDARQAPLHSRQALLPLFA